LTLHLQGQEVSGFLAYQEETRLIPIEKAELHGDQVTFEIHDNPNRSVSFRLTLTDGSLNGEARSADRVAELRLAPATRAGVFRVGSGFTAPVLINKTEPQFSEEARAAKYQGTVSLYVQVNPAGRAVNIRVLRG